MIDRNDIMIESIVNLGNGISGLNRIIKFDRFEILNAIVTYIPEKSVGWKLGYITLGLEARKKCFHFISKLPAFSDFSGFLLSVRIFSVSYTHLRAHETRHDLVCRLLLEKK